MGRELRRYERVACQEHFCDRCCNYIHAGDMYEGRVVVTDNSRLLVWKTHIHPSCDYPEEPEDYESLSDLVFPAEELKLAA